MSRMRSSMSKKNKWYIDSERYLELKHFCRQYKTWHSMDYSFVKSRDYSRIPSGRLADPTPLLMKDIVKNQKKVNMIQECCRMADIDIWTWLLDGVTEGLSYDQLKARGIPCGKDYYYDAYHKFFYILDKERK